MRKNTARHWLHAGLDLLPLILIPVFMVYSHRHNMTQQTSVDIQYKYKTNEVNNYDDLINGNLYHIKFENNTIDDFLSNNGHLYMQFVNINSYDFENYDIEFDDMIRNTYEDNGDMRLMIDINSYDCYLRFYLVFNPDNDAFLSYDIPDLSAEPFSLEGDFIYSGMGGYQPGIFDIITQSNYNVIESVDIHDEISSVMNVFMDNFNGAIDKYFNMGNVFGMTNVYQWFNTNIFGGNAPTIIFSVWNIVLYEFVMDLLFLLYALFMWFIDVTKRLIEKPLDSIK